MTAERTAGTAKRARAAIVIGVAVLLYFFFLQTILLLMAPRSDTGGGQSVIFFPPQADPVLRWCGVLLGAVVTAAGCVSLFVSRDRSKPTGRPALRLVASLVLVAALVGLVTVQSYVARLPDYLAQQFFDFQSHHQAEGIGISWPAQETFGAGRDPQARGTIEVVMAYHPDRERDHAYVRKLTEGMYQDWRKACERAARADGATLGPGGIRRPRKLTAGQIVDPAECAVYLVGESTENQWCIRRGRAGTVIIYGDPP